MIKTDELRGIIAKNNLSQAKVAEVLGITPKTFYEKMNRGVFGSDEIEAMIRLLKIDDPVAIFLPGSNFKSYVRVSPRKKTRKRGEKVER